MTEKEELWEHDGGVGVVGAVGESVGRGGRIQGSGAPISLQVPSQG